MTKLRFLLLLILSCVVTMRAQQAAPRYLLFKPSASSTAMGGVGVACYGNAFAAYFNPAALAFSSDASFTGSFVKPIPFFGNTVHSFLAGSCKIRQDDGLAFSANLYRRGKQVVTRDDPDPIKLEDPTLSWQGKISYAHAFNTKLAAGMSFGLVRFALSNGDVQLQNREGFGTGWMFDVGLLIKDILPEATWHSRTTEKKSEPGFFESLGGQRQSEGLSVGFALLNLGQKLYLIDKQQSDDLPATLTFGTSYWPVAFDLAQAMISIDLEKQLHESSTLDYVHFGGELTFVRMFSLRTGYFLDTYGPATSYGTLGFGVHVKFFNFNIARYTRAIDVTWHFDTAISLGTSL